MQGHLLISFLAMETHGTKLQVHSLVLMLMPENGWSSATLWLTFFTIIPLRVDVEYPDLTRCNSDIP